MKRKFAETSCKELFNYHKMMSIKYRDRQYLPCPHCGKLILIPKSDRKPDYLVAKDWIYVEAKNAEHRFNFITGITDVQKEVMAEVKEYQAWMFLEIGGRYPERKAYLIPWNIAMNTFKELEGKGYKSVVYPSENTRNPSTDIFKEYELEWKPKIKWVIPDNHIFWKSVKEMA